MRNVDSGRPPPESCAAAQRDALPQGNWGSLRGLPGALWGSGERVPMVPPAPQMRVHGQSQVDAGSMHVWHACVACVTQAEEAAHGGGVDPGEDVVVDRLCKEPAAVEDHVERAEKLDDEHDVGVHLEAGHEAAHAEQDADVRVEHGGEDEEAVQKHGEELDADHLLRPPLPLALLLVL